MTALLELAEAVGIAPVYKDTTGTEHETTPETAAAMLAAMGFGVASEAEAAERLAALRAEVRALPETMVVEAGAPLVLSAPGPWELTYENGETAEGRDTLRLKAVPLGRHRLTRAGQGTTLLSAPARLSLPPRGWGVTLPLYGLRTEAQGGYGDYDDLTMAVAGLAKAGVGFVGINPIHAGFPEDPGMNSPYSPSSRRRFNIAHIPAGTSGEPDGTLIDYAATFQIRRAALEARFAEDPGGDAFEAYLAREGQSLRDFATHQAISERFGPYWGDWPEALQRPGSDATRLFAAEAVGRVRFHAWLQWQAEAALARTAEAAADMAHGLYLDLAVGTHPHGAETWADPEGFARGVSIGAPPDAFSAEGQVWGLAPFNPRQLRATGFADFAETLRAQLRYAGLLRIDHILGVERSFWVPAGLLGAYVTMPREEMLAVIRIEAARAGATVVGEDLGNVPDGLRTDLAASGILGCAVMMFEQTWEEPPVFTDPAAYPSASLASFGTHDLPVWSGWRAGQDIAWRQRLGSLTPEEADKLTEDRSAEVQAFDAAHGTETGAPEALHTALAGSGAALVAVQIEDILGATEQPNLPGTIDEHPNWQRRLETTELGTDPRVAQTADVMRKAGRG